MAQWPSLKITGALICFVFTLELIAGRRHNRSVDANPTVRTRKQRDCVMQRRRSVPHTFEENIAAEKAKLEAKVTQRKPGPQMDALPKKIRQLETASHLTSG